MTNEYALSRIYDIAGSSLRGMGVSRSEMEAIRNLASEALNRPTVEPAPAMPTSFGMFSKAGNSKIAFMVKRMLKALEDDNFEKARDIYRTRLPKIAAKHGEATDTAVRESIFGTIDDMAGREKGDTFYYNYVNV